MSENSAAPQAQQQQLWLAYLRWAQQYRDQSISVDDEDIAFVSFDCIQETLRSSQPLLKVWVWEWTRSLYRCFEECFAVSGCLAAVVKIHRIYFCLSSIAFKGSTGSNVEESARYMVTLGLADARCHACCCWLIHCP